MPDRHEDHARDQQAVIEDVFISPRVVDQDAFARFAGRLKTLIEESTSSGAELRAAAARANEVYELLRREWSEGGPRAASVQSARDAIERIETRLREADDVLDALRERREARELVDDMRREAQEQIDHARREATEQVERMRREAKEHADGARRSAEAQIASAEQRLAARVDTVLESLERRAEEMRARERSVRAEESASSERLRALADECARRAEDAIARIGVRDEDVARAEQRLRAALEDTEREAGRLVTERLQTLDAQADERATAATERAIAAASQKINDQIAQRADALLSGLDEAAGRAAACMEQAEARLRDIEAALQSAEERAGRASAEAVEAALARAGERADARRIELEQSAESRLRRLESVVERANSLVGSNTGASHVPGSLGDLVDKGEKMRVAVANATQQLGALRAQADVLRSELTRLTTRAQREIGDATPAPQPPESPAT